MDNTQKLILVLVIILLAGFGGFLLYTYLGNKKKEILKTGNLIGSIDSEGYEIGENVDIRWT